jgi:hypothetical protein
MYDGAGNRIERKAAEPSAQTAEHNPPLFFGRKNRQYETKQTLSRRSSIGTKRKFIHLSGCESEHECGHTRVLLEEKRT